MAASRFAYVRDFELPDQLLPGTFILLRIDGHAFSKYPSITPDHSILIHPPTDSPMFTDSQNPTTPEASNLWIMPPSPS
jgi:hypothetical protein